jgi:hypothetical protein
VQWHNWNSTYVFGESVVIVLMGVKLQVHLIGHLQLAAGLISAGATTFVMTGDAEKAAKTGVGTAVRSSNAGTAIGATFGPGGPAIGGIYRRNE